MNDLRIINDAVARVIGAALASRALELTPALAADALSVAHAIGTGALAVRVVCQTARDGRHAGLEGVDAVCLMVLVDDVAVAAIQDVDCDLWMRYCEAQRLCYH
ncbi:MAG: hypothetical protein HY657_17150 [Acidobacteria bacterium]|nr:hypothetical protein [Acidobacteriota bacterium]